MPTESRSAWRTVGTDQADPNKLDFPVFCDLYPYYSVVGVWRSAIVQQQATSAGSGWGGTADCTPPLPHRPARAPIPDPGTGWLSTMHPGDSPLPDALEVTFDLFGQDWVLVVDKASVVSDGCKEPAVTVALHSRWPPPVCPLFCDL